MLDAPTGTVALLFSDIQGSTALWERLGERFGVSLALHDALIRAALDEFGGYEVKTEGDAFMVAFGSTADAIACCVALQQRLHDADWGDELLAQPECAVEAGQRGVRVRMGVHTGEPLAKPDPLTGRMDYFGPMVNRAARVSGAGHGGQVLVSGASWALAGASMPGLAVDDLGEHRLRGLSRPERLVQVLPQALADRVFPPPRTAEPAAGNLPSRATSFVGREHDLGRLAEAFSGHRLVTLLGPGGTGKTSLALRYAEGRRPSGGGWFADASQATDGASLCAGVARALDVPLVSGDPVAQLGSALLGRGPLLLILDNLEQVAQDAAAVVGTWLERAPELQVLATSRRPLHIAGEQQLPLDPLVPDHAVALFVERASEVKPGFSITAGNRADIEAIVADLDGLPLAIELAAARTRVLPPAAIRKRMSRRFDLLKGQRRGVPDRQATLRNAIEGSWDLLGPVERAALAQCSVFVGSFTLEAAERVLELPDDAWGLDAVEALVDHSLVRSQDRGDEPRFELLRSIQAFAGERLGASERAAAEARHGACFADLAREDEGDVDLGEAAHDLLAAATRAAARGDVDVAVPTARALASWRARVGPLAVGLGAVEAVLALDVGDADRAALLGDRARLLGPTVPPAAIVQTLQEAAELAEEAEPGLAATLRRELAGALRRAGQPEQAEEQLALALAGHQRLGDPRGAALDRLNQANVALGRGHRSEAIEAYREIAAELGRQEDPARGGAQANLGLALLWSGDLDGARDAMLSALAVLESTGQRRRGATVANTLGQLECDAGRWDEAEELLLEARDEARALGDRRLEGQARGNLGRLELGRGDPDAASEHLEAALAIHAEVGNRRSAALARAWLGEARLQADPAAARAILEQAIHDAEALGFQAAAGRASATLGRALAMLGAFEEARAAFVQAQDRLESTDAHAELARLLCLRAESALDGQDESSARQDVTGAHALVSAQPAAAADPEVSASLQELDRRLGQPEP